LFVAVVTLVLLVVLVLVVMVTGWRGGERGCDRSGG